MSNPPVYTSQFFHRNRYVGSFTAPYYPSKGELVAPYSKIFYCPVCGEEWGRILTTGKHGPKRWWAVGRKCAKHDGMEVMLPNTPGNERFITPQLVAHELIYCHKPQRYLTEVVNEGWV